MTPPPSDSRDRLEAGRRRYLDALLAAEPRNATQIIDDLVAAGHPVRRIYLEVLQPAMVEIGDLWQAASISVAHEHLATAVTETVLAGLAPRLETGGPQIPRSIVLTCSPGELHAVGLRMVADFLEADGWSTLHLGASTPAADLALLVAERRPDVVALSTSLAGHLHAAAEAIARIRALSDPPVVLLGGRAYGGDAAFAREIGGDLFAGDADDASRALRERFVP